jgi:hypothetical protein
MKGGRVVEVGRELGGRLGGVWFAWGSCAISVHDMMEIERHGEREAITIC